MQNVFIKYVNSLYEILDENKENLSFNIIKHEKIEELFLDKIFDKKNSLLIVKSINKSNLNKNFDDKNILSFQNLPILFDRLIELINVQLIQIKFNHQSRVIVKGYELNLNSKTIYKDNLILKLTEKEIEIILYLSKNKNKHNILDLQKNIWGYTADMETHTVETHIYRLRKKINDKFNDKNFIKSQKTGYFIE